MLLVREVERGRAGLGLGGAGLGEGVGVGLGCMLTGMRARLDARSHQSPSCLREVKFFFG